MGGEGRGKRVWILEASRSMASYSSTYVRAHNDIDNTQRLQFYVSSVLQTDELQT